MKKRAHVYYSGKVQGIGFRFTVIRLAEKLDVTGWVNNLEDARVELVAEAAGSALEDFLSQISNIFSRYIQNIDVSWEPATGEFKDFGVRF